MLHQKTPVIKCLFTVMLLSVLMVPMGCGPKKDAPEKATFYETGMKLFNEGYYDLMPQGKLDEANRKFEEAEKAFEQAIAVNSNAAECHRQLGRVYALRKKYSSAIKAFLRAAELEPENIENYLVLSSLYTRMKRYNDAERVLRHAGTLTADPSVVEQIRVLIKGIKAGSKKQAGH